MATITRFGVSVVRKQCQLRRSSYIHRWTAAPNVIGVPGAIHRGYSTIAEARRAYRDAYNEGQVKVINTDDPGPDGDLDANPRPPSPAPDSDMDDVPPRRNPGSRGSSRVSGVVSQASTARPIASTSRAGGNRQNNSPQNGRPGPTASQRRSPSGVTANPTAHAQTSGSAPPSGETNKHALARSSVSPDRMQSTSASASSTGARKSATQPKGTISTKLQGKQKAASHSSLSSPSTEITQIDLSLSNLKLGGPAPLLTSPPSRTSSEGTVILRVYGRTSGTPPSSSSDSITRTSSGATGFKAPNQTGTHTRAHSSSLSSPAKGVASYQKMRTKNTSHSLGRTSSEPLPSRSTASSSKAEGSMYLSPRSILTTASQIRAKTERSQPVNTGSTSARSPAASRRSDPTWSPRTEVTYAEPAASDERPHSPVLSDLSHATESSGHDTFVTPPSSPSVRSPTLVHDHSPAISRHGGQSSRLGMSGINSPTQSSTINVEMMERTASNTKSTNSNMSSPSYVSYRDRSVRAASHSSGEHTGVASETVRRTYSDAQIQTEDRRRDASIASASTSGRSSKSSSTNASHARSPRSASTQSHHLCDACHQPIQIRSPQPSTTRAPTTTGGDTVPATPVMPAQPLVQGNVEQSAFGLYNALGLSQSMYVPHMVHDSTFDPRSPISRSTTLPANSPSFGRPSPRMLFEGRTVPPFIEST
ncbi:hypothetical protein K474DRAFT_1665169 [Panus rudis PR-1116 ss-1]|nr:hypothetical protein K474DRAFT_1665169 [Panus rudis PR-1116 ss-1]